MKKKNLFSIVRFPLLVFYHHVRIDTSGVTGLWQYWFLNLFPPIWPSFFYHLRSMIISVLPKENSINLRSSTCANLSKFDIITENVCLWFTCFIFGVHLYFKVHATVGTIDNGEDLEEDEGLGALPSADVMLNMKACAHSNSRALSYLIVRWWNMTVVGRKPTVERYELDLGFAWVGMCKCHCLNIVIRHVHFLYAFYFQHFSLAQFAFWMSRFLCTRVKIS